MYAVQPSSIEGAGDGLFALEDIDSGNRFIEYYGRVLTFKQAKMQRNRNYMKVVSLNKHIDASDAKVSSPARYINDTPHVEQRNCKFIVENGKVFVETTRKVLRGEEFFVDYGRGHWLFCEHTELALSFLQLEIQNKRVIATADFKSGEFLCAHSSLHFESLFGPGIGPQITRSDVGANCRLRKNPVLTGTVLVESTRPLMRGEELILPSLEQLAEFDSKPSFFLTAFGKFAGVEENPTTLLLRDMSAHHAELRVLGSRVFETSIQGVDLGLQESRRICEAQYTPTTLRFSPIVYVHFGVHAGSDCFKLERVAKNWMDFGVPDEQGNQPRNTKIDNQGGAHELTVRLDLDRVCASLQQSGHRVCVSEDCGTFICNYAYYSSLQKIPSTRRVWGHDESLFVHVPKLGREFTEQAQLAFARDLLRELQPAVSRNGV